MSQEEQDKEQLDEIRTHIGNAVAFLQSVSFYDHLEELTFSAILADSIVKIEEDETDIRPGKINRLQSLKQNVVSSIDKAIDMPPELFNIEEEEEEDD